MSTAFYRFQNAPGAEALRLDTIRQQEAALANVRNLKQKEHTMDFNALPTAELVSTYNEMVLTAIDKDIKGFKVVKKFSTKAKGVARAKQLDALINPKKSAVKKSSGPKFTSRGKITEDMKITVLTEGNPKRGTAAPYFDMYEDGMTVAQYCKLADPHALLRIKWDIKKGFISVA
jgi:hypothetical protein